MEGSFYAEGEEGLVRWRDRNRVNDEFLFWEFWVFLIRNKLLGFPNEEQTLGLPAFNGTNPKSLITVDLKFK